MEINSILAFRNDRCGEFLLTIPAFWMLRRNYPEAKLDLVVDKNVRQLAQRIPFLNRLIVWENRKHRLGEILKFSQEARRGHYDLSVIFNPSRELNIISFLAGIPIRAGYDRKWGFLLNRRIKDTKKQGLKHEVDYNLELLKTIGIEAKPSDIRFPLEIRDEDFPDSRLAELGITHKGFIAFHPWASNPEKEWPLDKFKELAKRLSLDFGLKLLLIGGIGEMPRADNFSTDLSIINLTGKTNLIELAALLRRSRLLITNDSGPMHLAAVVGIPVVAIFRKQPAWVSAKRWGPVGENHSIIENDILANIESRKVLDGVKKILPK